MSIPGILLSKTKLSGLLIQSNIQQPSLLYLYGMTELFERFSYYALQAILVLFFVHKLHFNDAKAYDAYAAITCLLYIGPTMGGILSDKLINRNDAIIFGLILNFLGYTFLITRNHYINYFAFSLLIGGNSFLRATFMGLIGSVYEKNDVRLDSAYTIIYLFMNIGQIFGVIVTSLAAKKYGYDPVFIICGLSVIMAFLVFRHSLNNTSNIKLLVDRKCYYIYPISLIVLFIFSLLLQYSKVILNTAGISILIASCYLIYVWCKNRFSKIKLIYLFIIFISSGIYWSLWMQVFTSITLFADRNVNRVIFGYHLPTEFIITFECFGIILFAPIFSKLWLKLNLKNRCNSLLDKFKLGFMFVFMSFYIITYATEFQASQNHISIIWIILSFLFLSLSELCVSVISLSAISKLALPNLRSTVMGYLLLSVAFGVIISDKIANLSDIHNLKASSLCVYQSVYVKCILASLVMIALLHLIGRFAKLRLMID